MGGTSILEAQTRSNVLVCELGFYCQNGVKRPCPRGKYGNEQGLSTKECSGKKF